MAEECLSIIEDSPRPHGRDELPPWLLVVVDDDDSVHQATRFVLDDFSFEDRRVQILDAYSAKQARQIIAAEQETAVILLDVVMETPHVGLELVRWIRDDLENSRVRIILRTGQPGFAPALQVVRDYDINDYKEKSEMTATKLVTSVCSALRSFRDIVQLEAMADRLRHALAAAEVASRAKSSFITHMSHEFRTPLNGILGLSEMIANEILGPVGNSTYREYAWDIVASGRRLQLLLESVLELTENGEDSPLNFETFDLRELIREFFETQAKRSSVANGSSTSPPEAVPGGKLMLRADRRAVQSMLSNLVSNALTHNPPDVHVRVTARKFDDGGLSLSVIDDGVGIAPSVLSRLGDPFNMANDPYLAGADGLGLGLVATKKLIERHGGHMTVESARGTGTTVRLAFPSDHPASTRLAPKATRS